MVISEYSIGDAAGVCEDDVAARFVGLSEKLQAALNVVKVASHFSPRSATTPF